MLWINYWRCEYVSAGIANERGQIGVLYIWDGLCESSEANIKNEPTWQRIGNTVPSAPEIKNH
jgi:hypothetical protein